MELKTLINMWFQNWETGDFINLPITENFCHTSPFDKISGKKDYLNLVETNKDKFLGYRFKRHDEMYDKKKACVRYTAIQNEFILDVSEWYYIKGELIEAVIAYYHIGEIRNKRKLSNQFS
jgi:hypothetical protein